MGGELVMLAGSEQGFDKDSPGDTNRTTIRLAADLAYCYRRDTVVIYGNVVKATHGETRKEVLGAGDGSQALQQFTLKQPPLTYIPSATPAGAASTLVVRVNDVAWQEVDSLADLAPSARNFTTSTDDDGRTTVIFGNGQEGSRLPTGQENIRAVYRNGIGKPGNVKPKQISLLMSRPLGVKDVINPLRASGGADKESRDQARRNAPLAVMALDRLVSTRDYADFARTFAGIGKASAARLADGRRQLVHVTIAGADDIPIDQNSDVFRNLREALLQLGDPFLPIRLATRQLKLLVIQANVRVLAGYMWENVKPDVESALLAFYSFDQCGLGEDLQRSEAIGVIQKVKGVDYVDLDNFDALDEDQVRAALAANEPLAKLIKSRDQIIVEPAQLNPDESDPGKRITPAALAYLSPDVPSTILLNEIP
jgi:predicted phage baseplate assembly protein